MRIIIIGGSHGGISTARHLRKINPKIEVIIIEKSNVLGYIASSLNLKLEQRINRLEDSKSVTAGELLSEGINVMLNSTVTAIDPKAKQISFMVSGQEDTDAEKIAYDYLVLAMGSSTFRSEFSAEIEENIITYKTIPQSKEALKKIEAADKIAIIGAGLIGFELAESLSRLKKEVYLIDRMDTLLFRYFDEEISTILAKDIPKNIHILLNSNVEAAKKNAQGKFIGIELSNGSFVPADVLVYAVNPRPNVELAEGVLTLNTDGTIATNEYLQTSDPFIYAVGDLVSIPFNHSESQLYIPLVTNAYRTGIVAATNILLPEKITFPKSQRTVVSKLFGFYLGSSGVNETEAPYYGFSVNSVIKTFHSQAFFDKDDLFEITIKLVYDKKSKIIMGGQVITNQQGSLEIINILATLINTQTTLLQLSTMDYFFNPTLSHPLHFLNQLALEGLIKEQN